MDMPPPITSLVAADHPLIRDLDRDPGVEELLDQFQVGLADVPVPFRC
jgi:hypothetical protein